MPDAAPGRTPSSSSSGAARSWAETDLFRIGDFGDTSSMSHEPLLTEELIARQSPEAQAFIRLLLAKLAEMEARLNMTPRNSSLPPSTKHPHAKPTPQKEKSGKPGGPAWYAKRERALIPTEECSQIVPVDLRRKTPTRSSPCGPLGPPRSSTNCSPTNSGAWSTATGPRCTGDVTPRVIPSVVLGVCWIDLHGAERQSARRR